MLSKQTKLILTASVVAGVVFLWLREAGGAPVATVIRWKDLVTAYIKKGPANLRTQSKVFNVRTATWTPFYDWVPKILGAIHAISHGGRNFFQMEQDEARRGLLGLKYSTVASLGFTGTPEDLFNPKVNIPWGLVWLSQCKQASTYGGWIIGAPVGIRITSESEIWARFLQGGGYEAAPPPTRGWLATGKVEKIMSIGEGYREALYLKGTGPPTAV